MTHISENTRESRKILLFFYIMLSLNHFINPFDIVLHAFHVFNPLNPLFFRIDYLCRASGAEGDDALLFLP